MRLYHDQPSGTVTRARGLRREASAPERRLLRALREAFPLPKWRHQAPIGPFYADILCFSERLVIEVDGDTHATAATYDDRRSAFFGRDGYRVIRFTNAEITQNLEGVLSQVSFRLRARRVSGGKDEGDARYDKGDAR